MAKGYLEGEKIVLGKHGGIIFFVPPIFFAAKLSAVIRPRLCRVRSPHPPTLNSLRSSMPNVRPRCPTTLASEQGHHGLLRHSPESRMQNGHGLAVTARPSQRPFCWSVFLFQREGRGARAFYRLPFGIRKPPNFMALNPPRPCKPTQRPLRCTVKWSFG